jgi:flagellar export protein FliJ
VKTRLDRLVRLRESAEEDALAATGRARRRVADAEERLAARRAAASADGRRAEDAVLWALDDGARRRAIQAVRAAEAEVAKLAKEAAAAQAALEAAHRDTEVARRAADRKRAELLAEAAKKERKAADEVAAQRFGRGS